MAWKDSQVSFVWIFPVGRGNAAFLRSALNNGFILDMGGGEFVDPVQFVKGHFIKDLDPYSGGKIAQAVLSHPHSDHIRQCAELADGKDCHPALLTCPNTHVTLEMLNWDRIENPQKDEGLTDTYKKLYEKRNPPLQTIRYESVRSVPNVEYGIYYVAPPTCETLHEHESENNEYGNATSIMFYYRHGSHSILFPGDMTPEGITHLLNQRPGSHKRFTRFNQASAEAPEQATWHEATGSQPSLKHQLSTYGLTVLVAPHHGLESCYSSDLYSAIKGGKPNLVVLSERRKAHENDGSTDGRYQSEAGASGMNVEIDGELETNRRSVTTKHGHHILILFAGTGVPKVFANKEPKRLLSKLPT
jgi:hypothetical protein